MDGTGEPEAHFLPIDLERIVEDLLALGEQGGEPVEAYEEVFSLFTASFQLELAGHLKELKSGYFPFNPDAETLPSHGAPARNAESLEKLCSELARLLERANFEQLAPESVEAALRKKSPRGLQVRVDIEEFEKLGLWARGHADRIDETRVFRRGMWRKEPVVTPIYRRLCVFAKLKDDADPAILQGYREARDDDGPRTDCVYVKLFRDIAHTDLEMLLPNTQVCMTMLDKVKLGVTGGGGTIGGVAATVTKIGVATNPVTWGFALVGLVGVLWRQVAKLFHQRVRYMAALARKLYCRNLDNNFGAITRLVELAEEEECKESLLAWFFLVRRGEQGATLAQLDAEIEGYLRETYDLSPDFDVRDAVAKLRAADLLLTDSDDTLVARSAEDARERLAEAWDPRMRWRTMTS